jgi:hypothetical protein
VQKRSKNHRQPQLLAPLVLQEPRSAAGVSVAGLAVPTKGWLAEASTSSLPH